MQRETLKLVFYNKTYLILSVVIFVGLLIPLLIISQFIFLSPIFLFYVPANAVLNFSLIVILAALSGIVLSLSIYRIRLLGSGIRKSGTGFFGSIIGASAGACSCGPIGLSIISTFGVVGGTVTAFLTNYEIPLRLISIIVLLYTYYVSVRGITKQCNIVK